MALRSSYTLWILWILAPKSCWLQWYSSVKMFGYHLRHNNNNEGRVGWFQAVCLLCLFCILSLVWFESHFSILFVLLKFREPKYYWYQSTFASFYNDCNCGQYILYNWVSITSKTILLCVINATIMKHFEIIGCFGALK